MPEVTRQPGTVVQSLYRRELAPWALSGFALGMVEGATAAVLVKKGETVKKGQTIARAGASGGAASPRLHFEVRRGSAKTIDPMTVLPPG